SISSHSAVTAGPAVPERTRISTTGERGGVSHQGSGRFLRGGGLHRRCRRRSGRAPTAEPATTARHLPGAGEAHATLAAAGTAAPHRVQSTAGVIARRRAVVG